MKILDLNIKKNDKTSFSLKGLERNKHNNVFLIFGVHYFKFFKLKNNGDFIEEKMTNQRKTKMVKCATWSKVSANNLYFFDSNYFCSLNLNSNNKNTNKLKFEYDMENLSINCDDSILACCPKGEPKIDLLDLKSEKVVLNINMNNLGYIPDCQFSPIDPNYLIFSGDEGNIYFYDIRNIIKPVQYFSSESKEIISLDWHPTKFNIFCSGGMDNYIKIWDINDENSLSKAEFKTSEGPYKVRFLKSNPNYIISSYQATNYSINLWNIKFRDMPEYKFSGHESNIFGFDTDIDGMQIVSGDKKGKLIVHDLNKGKRILDDICTNIIKFNNNNEIYCFHDDKLQQDSISKSTKIDSKNDVKTTDDNSLKILKPLKKIEENLENIYMLNFNQKELQIKNKSSPNGEKSIIHLKKDRIIINNELKQYYIFTPEQISDLFSSYIYYIEKKETLYKRKRFQSLNALNKLDINDNFTEINEIDFPQKLVISISNNLDVAKEHIKNYNHIYIWKTLLNIAKLSSFKLVYNKYIKKEKKIIKKKRRINNNDVNKSFEKEKEFFLINNYKKNISPSSMKLITTLIINQLSKIIEYLIDDYGDIYLATIICYLFKPILFQDEKLKIRILKLIKDCVNNLRKYQLYVEANHLIKYGPEENNLIDESTFIFKYSCDCGNYNFKNGKCSCGKIITCEECDKKIYGLFTWCPSCGHEEHLRSRINKNKSEFYCKTCEK